MATTSTDTFRFLEKTLRLQFNLFETKKEAFVQVPVISSRRQIEMTHRWRFVYDTSETVHRPGEERVTCVFRLSGKHIGLASGPAKYDKSFFEARIVNTSGVVLCQKKADLAEPEFRQFKFQKNAQNTNYSETVFVEIKLQSYPPEGDQPIDAIQALVSQGCPTDAVIRTGYRRFPCHILSLTSKCGYFQYLREPGQQKPVVINWTNFADEETVRDFLHFVYVDGFPPTLERTWPQLMRVSRVCLMDELSLLCLTHLERAINVDNMCHFLETVLRHNSEELRDFVINYVVDNYDVNGGMSPPWEALEPELAKKLAARLFTFMVSKKLHV